jgi:hypothetical protein
MLILGLSRFYYLLRLPPSRPSQKIAVATAYFTYLLISLLPVAFEATLPRKGPDWFVAIFGGTHALFINPIVTALGIVALFAQAQESLSRTSPGALSIAGLAVQALVFTVVGISWIFRLQVSEDFQLGRMSPIRAIVTWYQLVGWAVVDNLVFAFVQAAMWFLVSTRSKPDAKGSERTPLMH